MPGALLHRPVRGALTVPERAADGLTFTEERRRIDCIELLRRKGYPQRAHSTSEERHPKYFSYLNSACLR